jgi:hypothetical protein
MKKIIFVLRAFPKTRLVLGNALEKAVRSPLFPHKSKVAFPKLKFWESLLLVPAVSFLLTLSCATAPAGEVPAAEEPARGNPLPEAAPPAPPPVRAEAPAFDPGSITQEVYDSTLNEIKGVIEELNKICTEAGKPAGAEKSYNAWLTWLTGAYAEQTRDPDYLALLSRQPALKSRNIKLSDQRGYFINVFAASRQNANVAGIEFTTPRRVKVWGFEYEEKAVPSTPELQQAMLDQGYELVKIRNQNRMVRTKKVRYYILEKTDETDDRWKIASLDAD